MLELKLRKTAVRLDFSFFASLALLMLTDEGCTGLTALAACGLHELSHLAVMIFFGISAERITFYGAGIRITSGLTEYAKPLPKVLILLAGCFGNFAGALILGQLGYKFAALINLFTGIFNLLPIGEFDGAVLLKMLLLRFCKPEKIDLAMRIAGIVSAVICIFVILYFGGISFSFVTTVLYIFTISILNV